MQGRGADSVSVVVAGCHVNRAAPKAEMQDMAKEEVPRVLYVKQV